ncbi:MAG: transketolase [Acidaminococcales bacterium]|jgi:transketolase|nr:transketolase [Acidaminococcales bacterium]
MNERIESAAKNARLNILRLANQANKGGNGTHIGPSLSVVEVLTALFFGVLRPQDAFILSKGHAGLAYYAVLKEAGLLTEEQLDSFETNGSGFLAHPSKNIHNGIICSSGSLGMGLSYACGLALAAKKQGKDKNIYVLLGDGELNEGSNWEAAMFAAHQKLDNLVAVVDYNGMQLDGFSADILAVDVAAMWKAAGWQTAACDGHSLSALREELDVSPAAAPQAVLAKTVKGKGVSFMENNSAWHHSRLSDKQYEEAAKEVGRVGI